jgi:16S rRNA G966 N2-methylase RsmD
MHLIKEQGILVVESADGDHLPDAINDIYKYKEKKYRNTKITYYRKGE